MEPRSSHPTVQNNPSPGLVPSHGELHPVRTQNGEWLWRAGPDRWSRNGAVLVHTEVILPYGKLDNARWSVPLKQLDQTYFEVTVLELFDLQGRIALGVGPENCLLGLYPKSEIPGGCWADWQPPFEYKKSYVKGDVIGWGINRDSQLFQTVNGKIHYQDHLPNEFSELYPFVAAIVCSNFFFHFFLTCVCSLHANYFLILMPKILQKKVLMLLIQIPRNHLLN